MKVREIMMVPPVSITATANVDDIARLMLDRSLSGVPVVDENGDLVGMVTEADLVAKHATVHAPVYFGILGTVLTFGTRHTEEDLRKAAAVTAAELMERDIVTADADAEVDDVASLMVEERANPISVLENGRLVGIVSQRDIVRLLVREDEADDQPEG